MITSAKYTLAALFAAALVSTASAQISPPFPSGVNTFSDGINKANYDAAFGPSGSNLYFDSDANVQGVISSSWAPGPLNLASIFGGNPFLAGGGAVTTIFIGETAGWTDDFGYTPSNSPSSHIALATDIKAANVPTPGFDIVNGQSTTVNYAAGTTLDFFLNSGGDLTQGGLFYAFGTGNQFSGSDVSNHIHWSTQLVNTTYFNGTSFVTAPVTTLLVGFEDTRQGVSFYDGDFNDIVVGFQFLPTQPNNPVPEPSTYGLLGAAALVGLVAVRRFKRTAKAA